MNTTPPAVAIDPPILGVPVLGTPLASSSANEPSGTRHAISPVLTLTAISSPHGGYAHSQFFLPSQNTPARPSGGLSGPTRRYIFPSSFFTSLLIIPSLFVLTKRYPSV